ncbi:anti-sigma factor domain-containing protein [Natronincola peptidivorans]|uniref:anti-sigma factor domain-containing protein n=1 Tax=Natronincola peptidivorans TaxID=426128 RepID=UPI000A4BEFED|nr:anti-sigma factor domain-containing protein [Natronincola peptidivorans]
MKYKGCIMEIRNNSMMVMTTECSFHEIEKRQYAQEGMEIEFHKKEIINDKKSFLSTFYLAAAAILLLILTSAYGFQYWSTINQSMALITIDINPSLQLEINHKNQVLKAHPLNEEAKTFPLQALKKKSLKEAFKIVLREAKEKGYMVEEEENYILVTSVLLRQDAPEALDLERIIEKIKDTAESEASIAGEEIQVITMQASKETLQKAIEDNISVGKLNIYKETKEYSEEEISSRGIQDMKIKELIQLKKAHPVFDQHPGEKENKKDTGGVEKNHPVFDQHPGEKENKKDTGGVEKSHPVFEQHPSEKEDKKDVGEVEKKHPVFEQHPSEKENKKDTEEAEKNHPVFEQHPGKKKDNNR